MIVMKKVKYMIAFGEAIMRNGRTNRICKICGQEGQRGQIRTHIHVAMHIDSIAIKCDMCESIFISRNSLNLNKFKGHL